MVAIMTSTSPSTRESERLPVSVRLGYAFRRYLVTGLATLFPVAVTVILCVQIFQFTDRLLGRWVARALGFQIPGLGAVALILVILLVGIFSVHLFGRAIFRAIELWFNRLPLVRKIYPPVKQLAQFLFQDQQQPAAFRRVVLVQYPCPGIYSLAFVTNETETEATGQRRTLLTLLIPQPPSPFTGPIVFVPKEEVIPLDLSVEDVLKLIVSGGVVGAPLKAASAGPR
jgi:uncharacterized membrane protein